MPLKTAFPAEPGSYILELFLAQPTSLQIARLGQAMFPAGAYLYFGSACGPGGLRARLSRHLLPAAARPMHWHIDYLRAFARIRALGYLVGPHSRHTAERPECLWSRALARLPECTAPLHRFGASDCRLGCQSHLLAIRHSESLPEPVLCDQCIQNQLIEAVHSGPEQQSLCWFEVNPTDISQLDSLKNCGRLR